jgi:hypothetical protein
VTIRRYSAGILLLIFSQTSFAWANCGIIDVTERITAAHVRVLNAKTVGQAQSDISLMTQELGRTNASSVAAALTNLNLPTQSRHIVQYIHGLEFLPMFSGQNQARSILTALATDAQRQRLDAAMASIGVFGCDPRTDINPLQNPEKLQGADNLQVQRTPEHLVFQLRAHLTTFFVILLSLIAIVGVWQQRKQVVLRKKRRGKRYLTNIPIFVRLNNDTGTAHIKDISCYGAKLKIDQPVVPKVGDIVSIYYETRWLAAAVSWSNQHYCGLQFQKRLSQAHVRTMISPEFTRQQVALSQQKTAPEYRAPLSN